jgi:DNA (cytosine-5)-methyltransferase 1
MTLKISGLFAGIGGFEEGLKRAGHCTVQLCEADAAARAVLAARFPDVEIDPDIRDLRRLERCDAVVAGFPCQDLSQAGLTEGIHGKSSGLVKNVFRILEATRPRPTWLVLENVPFMLKLSNGKAMKALTSRIEQMNWRWAYRVVDSRSFGLAHRRRRVILVASKDEDPCRVLFADDTEGWYEELPEQAAVNGFYWTEGNTGLGWAVDAIPTLKGGSGLSIPSPPGIWDKDEEFFGTPTISDAERLQGFPRGWTSPAKSVVNGDRQRWRLVGNAVSVPVAKWIGTRLSQPGEPVCELKESPLKARDGWPNAAWGDSSGRYAVELSEAPLLRNRLSLEDSLRDSLVPLSFRAASGFYERLKNSDLRTEKYFKRDLRGYVAQARLID